MRLGYIMSNDYHEYVSRVIERPEGLAVIWSSDPLDALWFERAHAARKVCVHLSNLGFKVHPAHVSEASGRLIVARVPGYITSSKWCTDVPELKGVAAVNA